MADSKPIVIDVLKGLDQRWPAGAPSAAIAQDLWWNPKGGWESSGGYKRIIQGPAAQEGGFTNPFRSSGAIESIHWFSQHTGARRWLIYIDGSGNLYQFNPSTAARSGSPGDAATDRAGNTLTRTVVTTPWQRSQSACWGDQFYMVNGIDGPITFNGYWWDVAGWSGPAGTVSAVAMNSPHADDENGGEIPNVGIGPTSTDAAIDYKVGVRYRVSFVNDRGAESPLSAPSELVYNVNTGGGSVSNAAFFAKVSLPIGPANCVARRVYRTQNVYDSSNTLIVGRDQEYYFHSEEQNNCTDTFMDSLPDGYLGSLVDDTQMGAWPLGAKYIASFKGRMYAVVNGNLFYSKRGNPEQWPVNNAISLDDANLGPITVLYATRNVMLVAKSRGIYLVKDDGINEPLAETLTLESGWSSQNTVCEIPGIGILGLSDDGVTFLKGTLQNEGVETQTFNAAVALPDTFSRINKSAILNACSAVYHKDKEWWLAIPTVGSPVNNLVLVYHYEIKEWTTRLNYPISSILETPDSAGTLLFGSYAATTGISPDGVVHLGIMQYSRGCADKDGTAIEPIYQTNQISIASLYRTFKPLHILVNGIGHGNNALGVNIATNYSLTNWMSTALTVQQQWPQEVLPVYGDGTVGTCAVFDSTDRWQNWRPITMRVDLTDDQRQPVFAAEIRMTPETGKRYMTIFSLSLEVTPDSPLQVKPLKPDSSV